MPTIWSFNGYDYSSPGWAVCLHRSPQCPSLMYNQLSGSLPSAVLSVLPVTSATLAGNCITNQSLPYVNCDIVSRAALVDLFVSTSPGRTQWSNANTCGWLANTNPCSWLGVQCFSGTGPVVYVTHVAWLFTSVFSKRQGTKSPCCAAVGCVHRSVTVVGNNVAGTIPTSIGSMSGLTGLDLSQNPLFGTIPSTVGLLTNLVYDIKRTSLLLYRACVMGNPPGYCWRRGVL